MRSPVAAAREAREARVASRVRLARRIASSSGCLAQLVERRPYKANVGGSIPSAPTSTRQHVANLEASIATKPARTASDAANRGVVVQLVRIPACHAGGRGFESRPLRQTPSTRANASSPFFVIAGDRSRTPRRSHDAMFDLVHKHKRVAQVILALITLPFAFFGVDYYFRGDSRRATVATVGGDKITQSGIRRGAARAAGADAPAARRQLRSGDVRQPRSALRARSTSSSTSSCSSKRARADRFRVTDAQLQQFIARLPPFQEDGKFSADRYKHGAGGAEHDAADVRAARARELMLAPLQEPIVSGNIVARASARALPVAARAAARSRRRARSTPSRS